MMVRPKGVKKMPKLSTWHILLLSIGILVKAGCICLLGFLWFASTENLVWQRIVLNDWATRMVVIVSLVIRTVVGLHGVLCISMLSALILEGYETPLSKVAAISIMRFQNGGAFDLAGFLFLLRGGKPTIKRVLLAGSSGLLFAVLVGLQLTSTALLSDFGARSFISRQPEREYNYTFGYDDTSISNKLVGGVALWNSMMMTTPSYPAFVEYSEPPGYDLPDGVFDTGTLIRGFLPIDQESNRSVLAQYSGPVTFFDNRVACLRPAIPANLSDIQLSVSTTFRNVMPETTKVELRGKVESPNIIPKLPGGSVVLNCSAVIIPTHTVTHLWGTEPQWPLTICPTLARDVPHSFSTMNHYSSRSLFVLNTSYTGPRWSHEIKSLSNNGENSEVVLYPVSAYDLGEWLHVQFPHGLEVSISLCYVGGGAQTRNATVSRELFNASEPASVWNSSGNVFETAAIRQQLGAISDTLSISNRGLFELSEPPSSWVAFDESGSYLGPEPGFTTTFQYAYESGLISLFLSADRSCGETGGTRDTSSLTSSLCYSCYTTSSMRRPDIHLGHVAVLTDILRDTLSPGKALQALFTSFNSKLYYTQSSLYTVRANGTEWVRVSAQAPVQAVFFRVIVVAIVVETVLVICIALAFIRGTRYSSLGNAWQAVSQVAGEDADKWKTDSSLTDKEIVKLMKHEGVRKRIVGLVDKGENKIRVREAPPKSQSGISLLTLSEIRETEDGGIIDGPWRTPV